MKYYSCFDIFNHLEMQKPSLACGPQENMQQARFVL